MTFAPSFIGEGNGTFEGELLIKDDKTFAVLTQVPIRAKRINAPARRR